MPLKPPRPASGVPPKEALDFFRAKKVKPGFGYQDVWQQEHATAFTVAKVLEKSLLLDIQESLTAALEQGTPFNEWAEGIRETFDESGWSDYGEEEETPRRLKTVYDTNMRMARAVGQAERVQRTKRALPYLEYNLGPSKVHREQHEEWEGLVLPVDDPFWESHYPPSGYGCKCWVRQVTRGEAEKLGVDEAPDVEEVEWELPDGTVETAPRGVHPAFNYPKTQAGREEALADALESAGNGSYEETDE